MSIRNVRDVAPAMGQFIQQFGGAGQKLEMATMSSLTMFAEALEALGNEVVALRREVEELKRQKPETIDRL